MGVNRPDVSLGRCLMWSLSRTRPSRAAGSGGFFGPPTLHRGPDEPQYFADHRRRNPLYRKGFRCNYTFGTGTKKCNIYAYAPAAGALPVQSMNHGSLDHRDAAGDARAACDDWRWRHGRGVEGAEHSPASHGRGEAPEGPT